MLLIRQLIIDQLVIVILIISISNEQLKEENRQTDRIGETIIILRFILLQRIDASKSLCHNDTTIMMARLAM